MPTGFNIFAAQYYAIALGLRGCFSDEFYFRVRRGKQEVVKYVPPQIPTSPLQLAWQEIFRQAMIVWKLLTPLERNSYNNSATRRGGMTGCNLFLHDYLTQFK